MANIKPASTLLISRSSMVDKDGVAVPAVQKIFQQWDIQLQNGLSKIGQIAQPIPAAIQIQGRTEGIGSTVQNIDSSGVVTPSGLPAATPATQGAVVMPAGAPNNHLGSAAIQSSSAFDPAGSAATAQASAQAFATAAASTAQSNAETFASNASNLASGTVALALLPGISVTITTAKLTVGGANGSMTFTNGILTAQVQAT